MRSLVRQWGPLVVCKLNLVYDLTAVMLSAAAAERLAGRAIDPRLLACAGCLALCWSVESFVVRYYDRWANRSGVEEIALACLLVVGVAAALGAMHLVVPRPNSLPGITAFVSLLCPAVLAARLLVFRKLDFRPPPVRAVLIVGVGPMGRCTAEDFEANRQPVKVVGHLRFASDAKVESVRGAPVLGDVDDLQKCLRAAPIDEIYVAGDPARHGDEMQRAVRVCERFGVPFALPAYSLRLERARPADPAAVADGYLHYLTHAPRPYQRSVKRLFDIFVSAAALLLLSPLFVAVALLIKLTSNGPVFFRQARVGLHGRPFNIFKFRTMVVDAEALKDQLLAHNEQTGPVFKMRNDPRITPLGRFLRKHSIDELPQLINVLRGDMSIVGPRPPVPQEVARYEGWQRRRLSVRPGLTCIWQVSGRNQITFQEWMYLDMRYIDHWSITDDLNLILKTLPIVVTGRGAS
ncbi:MAG TPA: sugar transferase [Myxococcales bacterium]|nr:sugar transferase [Myxococcales bacterium]